MPNRNSNGAKPNCQWCRGKGYVWYVIVGDQKTEQLCRCVDKKHKQNKKYDECTSQTNS